ncbi:tRNA-dependent cyclodipeptide synthase [Streptomyces sp. NPDC049585]|uniref:tRNA-dependent cyclodipeptide synthase n=1 Tax=Streptomyces sp. NPDC049585 TaxID=3155154 RepID=UPI00343D661E
MNEPVNDTTAPPALGRTKAGFGEDAKQLPLHGRKAVLLISVGQRYHEGDKLQATVDLANRSGFGQVTIAVADTLQRTNYTGLPPEQAYAQALAAGDAWLARNAAILDRLTMSHPVLRWDQALRDPMYPVFRERIEHAYHHEPDYRQAVHATVARFLDRLLARRPDTDTLAAFHDCLAYLIEELPLIMPTWAHRGHDYVIYPQPMTTAMAETRRRFVATGFPGKAAWLSLRFKKRALSPGLAA